MPPRLASRPVPPRALALRRARLLLLHPAALAARVCPCCSRRARAAPATPACSPGARPSLRRHPLAGGGMSPHAAPSRLASNPRPALAAPGCPCCTRLLLLLPASQGSTGDPRLPSRRKAIALQAPPSRGWHVASCRPAPPRAFAIHQNGTFGERLLPHLGNLPGKGPFSRKVLRFSGGPSMPGAVFPEGPAFFRGTFHARGRFPGRPCVFQGDLPC